MHNKVILSILTWGLSINLNLLLAIKVIHFKRPFAIQYLSIVYLLNIRQNFLSFFAIYSKKMIHLNMFQAY